VLTGALQAMSVYTRKGGDDKSDTQEETTDSRKSIANLIVKYKEKKES
jgi:hypothetical protein